MQQGTPRFNALLTKPKINLGFRKADNARVAQHGHMGGWDQMRSRMVGTRTHDENGILRDDGVPMMGYLNTCVNAIRTIPAAQHDPNRAEDLAANDDHPIDTSRYFCMSRPWREKTHTAEIISLDVWGRRKQVQSNWKVM